MNEDAQKLFLSDARDQIIRSGRPQSELAKRLGIDQSAVSRLLAGSRGLKLHEVDEIRTYLDGLHIDSAAGHPKGASVSAAVHRKSHVRPAESRLRAAREAAGMSRCALANAAGVAESTVRAIENGQNGLRPANAEIFGQILGVRPEALVFGYAATPQPTSETACLPHYRALGLDEAVSAIEALSKIRKIYAQQTDEKRPITVMAAMARIGEVLGEDNAE